MKSLITVFEFWKAVPLPTKLLVAVIVLDGCRHGIESTVASLVVAAAHVYEALHRR